MNANLMKLGRLLSKNSPTILTGISVAGLLTTVVLAVKATPKVIKILEMERNVREHESPNGTIDPISKKDIIKLTWKCYLPTAIMGTVTIGCIVGLNSIHLRRSAALGALYSISEMALKEYQAKIIDSLGEDRAREIKESLYQDRLNRHPVEEDKVFYTGNGDTLCYDALSGRYFRSDREYIRKIINDLNQDMQHDMLITVNDIYDALDLKHVKLGDITGWQVNGGLIEPEFSSQLTDKGLPCLVLDFKDDPCYTYRD